MVETFCTLPRTINNLLKNINNKLHAVTSFREIESKQLTLTLMENKATLIFLCHIQSEASATKRHCLQTLITSVDNNLSLVFIVERAP